MVAMVSKMLKNYNYIVQTVLFLALAIGTQGKAEHCNYLLIFLKRA